MTRAWIVYGLGYGDEGKGQVVDHVVREHGVGTVMRFSGGAQAAHNVITADGRHHTFAQFGSGTFAGADTYLGRDMMINPLDMFNEFYHLASVGEGNAWDRLSVNDACLVTTPVHEAANLLKEYYRRRRAHGTTGKGIGETRAAHIHASLGLQAGWLADKDRTRQLLGDLIGFYGRQQTIWANHPVARESDVKWSDRLEAARSLLYGDKPDIVEQLVDRYSEWASRTNIVGEAHLKDLLRNSGAVVLEGSQGVLLDEKMGFHPHTTWSDVTPWGARTELRLAGLGEEEEQTIGVIRSYMTRHGNGPFPSEERRRPMIRYDQAPLEMKRFPSLVEPHNAPRERTLGGAAHEFGTAGEFRRSFFDVVGFQYAIRYTRPDAIAVTHLDAFDGEWAAVVSYDYFGDDDVRRYLLVEEEGEITGIHGGSIADMECTTRRLFDCYPNYEVMPPGDDPGMDIVNAIQAFGGVPVTIVGEGPSSYRTLEKVAV